MKKQFCMMLLIALFTVITVVPQEANPSTWQKIKNFTSRNKGKIVALGLTAIAVGVGIAAANMVKDKADSAIKKAGIESIDYENTLLLLVTVGLLPEETGIKFMTLYFTKKELAIMWQHNAIKALAYYWDDNPKLLYAKLIKEITAQEAEAIKREVNAQVDAGMNKLKAAWQSISE